MSTQVDSLSIRIESTSKDASVAIDQLVKSLQQLKSAGNLSGITKGLQKISTAVNSGMKNVPTQFTKAAQSADKFAKSTNSAAASAGKLGSTLSGMSSNLVSFVANTAGIYSLGQALATSLDMAREWEGISARFAEGFGDQVDEVYAHVQKLSDALYINDQVFMQYSSNFATLARGFGVTESAITDMSVGLTELAYDIYAKNNDFYNFEEALLAVRSALVGEVEPIRLAGISITEATLKEVAAANGITESVENMTEAEKALLRYKAMVDQAYASGTVGTYIKELGTVEGSSRALAQQLKGLAQSIGSLVMPAISAVLPYFQALVVVATRAINAIASLFGLRIKAPTWSSGLSSATKSADATTNSLQNATKAAGQTGQALSGAGDAAKKLKDYMMGFDELNVITPQDDSSSGGGGSDAGGGIGGGGLELEVGSLWTDEMIASANLKAEEIANNIQAFFKPLGDAIKKIDFEPLVSSAKRLWEALKPFAATVGAGLYWFLLNVLVPLAAYTIENIIPDFLNGLAAVLEWVTPQLKEFGNWVVENQKHILTVAGYVAAFFLSFKLVSLVKDAIPSWKGIGEMVLKAGKSFKEIGVIIMNLVRPALSWLAARVAALIIAFNAGGGGLAGALNVVRILFAGLGSLITKILGAVFSPFTAAVIVVASTAMVLAANWDKVVAVFKTFMEKIDLAGKFEAIKAALAPMMEKLAGLKDLFTVIGVIGAGILAVAMGSVAGAFNMVVSMVAPLIEALGGVIDILAGIGSFIVAVFTGDWNKAWESIKLIGSGITDLFGGLWDAVVAGVTGFVEGVIDWFTSLWDTLVGHSIVPDTINSIIDWFLSLPGAILDTIMQFVADVVAFFESLWTDIEATWQGVSAWFGDLFTTAWTNIKSAWKNVGSWFSSKWTSVKNVFLGVPTWFKSKFTDAWTQIKSVFSGWVTFFSGLWSDISSTFSNLGTTIGEAVGGAVKAGVNSVLTWVEDTINGAIDSINAIIEKINSFTGVVGINIGTLGSVTIPKLASGGFVDEGQLFIAREAGAEMVGSMGGHTAVANNDQIVEGISSGVYAAVRAAMSENSGSNTIAVEVYLDGKRVTDSVEKRQRERGATIMTGGVNFGY